MSAAFWTEAPVGPKSTVTSVTQDQKDKLDDALKTIKEKIGDNKATDKAVDEIKGISKDKILELLKIPAPVAKIFTDFVEIALEERDPGPVKEELEVALRKMSEKDLDEMQKELENAEKWVELIQETTPSNPTKDATEKVLKALRTLKQDVVDARKARGPIQPGNPAPAPAQPAPPHSPVHDGPGITPPDRHPNVPPANPEQPTHPDPAPSAPPEAQPDAPPQAPAPHPLPPPDVPKPEPTPQQPVVVPGRADDGRGNDQGGSVDRGGGDFHPGTQAGGAADRNDGRGQGGGTSAGGGGEVVAFVGGRFRHIPEKQHAARGPSCLLLKGARKTRICLVDPSGQPMTILDVTKDRH